MSDRGFIVLYRFRYLLGGLLIIASLLLLALILSFINIGQAQAQDNATSYQTDSANIITDGFDAALDSATHASVAAISAGQNLSDSVLNATAASGKFVARGVYGAALAAAHGVGKSVSFAADTPAYAWHGVSSVAHIGTFIKPSEADKTPIPQIDPTVADELAGSKSIASTVPALAQDDTAPQWPIHGAITEEFGVPHWPWQPLHTGIDISDGAAQGVTPIRAFKPGRVIVVTHSNSGFGNHVIIDHGNGLTSLYGHMYATAVQVGQVVDKNTVLGYEGTTGASTGVHVHFEIDLNGQPVNPHQYVQGQP